MADFEDLDVLRDDGVVARITRRTKANGFVEFTFSIGKEFERPGRTTEQTKYIGEHQLGPLRRIIDRVENRIALERASLHAERREARR